MDSYTQPHFSTSALITIDMQNDFILDEGASPIPGTRKVIAPMLDLLQTYRQSGLTIVHVVRLYLRDGSNAELCRRKVIEAGLEFVAPESEGAELIAALKPETSIRLASGQLLAGEIQTIGLHEFILYKPRWGAFYGTQLNAFLRQRGVDTLVIAGCNYPNCPRTTLYEASERDYRLVVATDALSRLYAKGEEEMLDIGVCLLSAKEILERMA
jgi:nicotinamidase-related amidase